MKKILLLTVAVFLLFAALASCGEKAEEAGSGETTAAALPEGTLYENDRFSVTVAKGWEYMDIDGGVQIYKMSGEVVQIYIRGSNMADTEPKSQIESQSQQYGGTAPQEVDKWGKSWWTTSYTAMEMEQLKYLRIEGGQLVSVAAAAKDVEADADIMGMLESVAFK